MVADAVTTNSVSAAKWTLVSRFTGFLRVALILAVLGPTSFGNLFQAANQMPWYIYELSVGSLLASLLVPAMVRAMDTGDPVRQRELAGRFLGVVVTGFSLVTLAFIALTPLLANVLTDDSVVDTDAFRSVAVPLLALTAPQLIGYGIIATAAAVQNAHGRFAFPAGAPAIENLIVIAALILYWVALGSGTELADVTTAHWLLLGGASTFAVGVHTMLQWSAAARLGVPLVPRGGWRDPELVRVLRVGLPSAGVAVLNGSRLLLLVVAASQIVGGWVAFSFALTVLALPVALAAKPVATAMLPDLSRRYLHDDQAGFRSVYQRGIALTALIAVPATFALLLLGRLVANASAVGEMNTELGRDLLLVALVGSAVAIAGEALYQLAFHASFARQDAAPPLVGMAVRLALTAAGVMLGLGVFDGTDRLLVIAVAMSVADLVGAAIVHRGVIAHLPPIPERLAPDLGRSVFAGIVAFAPLAVIATLIDSSTSTNPGALLGAGLFGAIGFGLFLAVRAALGHHQLGELRTALLRRSGPGDRAYESQPTPAAEAVVLPMDQMRFTGLLLAWLAAAIGAGAAVGLLGTMGFGLVGAAGLAFIVAYHPPAAAWVLIAGTPFIVGFERGQLMPLLRPNEALLVVILVVLIGRWMLEGAPWRVRFNKLDVVVMIVVATGSAIPLMLQFGRLRALGMDDVFYALALVKFGLVYAVVRTVIKTEAQVRVCLYLSVIAASALGLLAVADSLNLGGVAFQLQNYFPVTEGEIDDGRGGATIGNAIGLGGYMAINFYVALGLYLRRVAAPLFAILAMAGCGLGIIGSGQFGPFLAAAGAGLAYAIATRSIGRILRLALPGLLIAVALLWPVVERRLTGLDGPAVSSVQVNEILADDDNNQAAALQEADPGSSWDVRRYNLETYFLPEFEDVGNVVFGVTPQARVAAPEPWRDWIWIESGHLWLLWTGGIPFLVAFVVLLVSGMRYTFQLQSGRNDALGVAAAAAFAGLWVLAIGQTFDPFITLRGIADILWPMLALGVVAAAYPRPAPPVARTVGSSTAPAVVAT